MRYVVNRQKIIDYLISIGASIPPALGGNGETPPPSPTMNNTYGNSTMMGAALPGFEAAVTALDNRFIALGG